MESTEELKGRVLELLSKADEQARAIDTVTVTVPINSLDPSDQPDRFTIRLNAYWEHFSEEPIGREVVASKVLGTTGIEPYIRKITVTEELSTLKLGDIDRKDVGYLLIYNLEGLRFQRNPSLEELEDIKKKIVVIDGFELYPFGMPFFGQPSIDQPLMVKCLHGKAAIQLCIFPR